MTTREVASLAKEITEVTRAMAQVAQFQLCELLAVRFDFDGPTAKQFISRQQIVWQSGSPIYFTDLVGHTMISLSVALCDILSRKYNFEYVEALEFLGLSGYTVTPPKLVRQNGLDGKATTFDAAILETPAAAGAVNKPNPIRRRKARNGWLLFIKELRPLAKIQLAQELDCRENQLQSHEVMTVLGARWRTLTDEQRVTWGVRARGVVGREELTGI